MLTPRKTFCFRVNTSRPVRRSWSAVCTLCCLRPKKHNMLKNKVSCAARYVVTLPEEKPFKTPVRPDVLTRDQMLVVEHHVPPEAPEPRLFGDTFQKAYRDESKKEAGCSLYAQMPQTIQTVFAQELTRTQSDVSPAQCFQSAANCC